MTRGTLCDVTLRAGEVSLPCHRVILAANSDYFAAMFTGGLAEENMETVEIQGVEAGALTMLVDYCYTGKWSQKYDRLIECLIHREDKLARGHSGESHDSRVSAPAPGSGRGLLFILQEAPSSLKLYRDPAVC